jgi:hypothetical protein
MEPAHRRGGIKSQVGEYSLSAVGPGPRAQRHWEFAQRRGLRPMAKMQINCSWELSAVPSLPVLDLVARHCENVRKLGVNDLMLSWTVGGYPSINLRLAGAFAQRPDAPAETILQALSEDRYSPTAASHGRKAWTAFSHAFTEYPYHGSFLYFGPMRADRPIRSIRSDGLPRHHGRHGLRRRGYLARHLSARVLAASSKRSRLAGGRAWLTTSALVGAAAPYRQTIEEDQRLAEAALLHLQSAATQVRFILARNALRAPGLADADVRSRPL